MFEKESHERPRSRVNLVMLFTIIICIVLFLVATAIIPILALSDLILGNGQYSSDPAVRARWLLQQVPLIDGHNDLPTVLYEVDEAGLNYDISKDPSKLQDEMIKNLTGTVIHTTIPRLRKTNMGGQFWSTWVSCNEKNPLKTTFEKFSIVYGMVDKYPNDFQLALSASDVWKAFREKKIASLFGIEGGHSLGGNSLMALRSFYKLGARYMTLTHTCNTDWADSANGPLRVGLTEYGKSVIKEMNDLGMMVDISHVSDRTMMQTLEMSNAPVIFSHSGARSVCNHIRNVPDSVLTKVKEKGAVVMVPFYPNFVSNIERQLNEDLLRRYNGSEADVHREQRKWQAENPFLRSNISHVIDHIDHIKNIASIDNIGLGGDYDGIPYTVKGLEDVSKYFDLVVELIKRGYSNDDIKKIIGLNILRVFEAVETYAHS